MSNAFMSNDLGYVFEKAFPFCILVPDQKSGTQRVNADHVDAPHPLFKATPATPHGEYGGAKIAAIPTRVAQTTFAFLAFFIFSKLVWKNAKIEIHPHRVRVGC